MRLAENASRTDYLRNWLDVKGYTNQEINSTLSWFQSRSDSHQSPTDRQILEHIRKIREEAEPSRPKPSSDQITPAPPVQTPPVEVQPAVQVHSFEVQAKLAALDLRYLALAAGLGAGMGASLVFILARLLG